MKRLLVTGFVFLVLGLARGDDTERSPEAAATVVVYNQKDPSSLALAKYYAGRRNIPDTQLVGLDCSSEEEISRDEYLVDIEAPLRDAFTKRGWWKISIDAGDHRYVESASMRFMALIKGVPMKIRPADKAPASATTPSSPSGPFAGRDEASVDSELAALFTQLDDPPPVIENAYYRRISPILSIAPRGGPLLVCRLDGPSVAVVHRMIDDALATEKTGLWGWAYLDARSITTAGYIEGDQWLTHAGELMTRRGIPVISDYAPEVFPEGFPVTNAAVYYGWYEPAIVGPFAVGTFRFVPGAIAVHIQSFSAATIRTPRENWAGPLVLHGAAATMGNVYEPYLALTVNLDILQDRLMTGLTLAESAYSATRGLSWMNVVLGDPLYRPYASWHSLDSGPPGPPNIWQQYRDIILQFDGDPLAAADALRKLAAKTHNSMPIEALGQAQGTAKLYDTAIQTLTEASKMESSRAIRFRLVLEQIELLRRAGRKEEALKKVSTALGEYGQEEEMLALGKIALALRPPPPSPTPKPGLEKK